MRVSGCLANFLRQSDPLICEPDFGLAKTYLLVSRMQFFFILCSIRKSSDMVISLVSSTGTFLPLFPLITILVKSLLRYRSSFERHCRASSFNASVSLLMYVSRSILAASPWCLRLNSIICERMVSLSMLYAMESGPCTSFSLASFCMDFKYL